MASSGQNFSLLFGWWLSINAQQRHVWPGLAAYRVADGSSSPYTANEIVAQIAHVRTKAGAPSGGASGTLLYNTTVLRQNRDGLADALGTSFQSVALVPAFPWLDNSPPPAPSLSVTTVGTLVQAQWSRNGIEAVRWWFVQWRTPTEWNARIVWGALNGLDIPSTGIANQSDAVVVRAIDGAMNVSAPAVWRRSP
jgi:hypothetical protein